MKYIDRLETKDLILGKGKIEDAKKLYENYWSCEVTAKYMLWSPEKTLEDAISRMERTIEFQKDNLAFIIYEKSSNEPIGQAAMKECEKGVFEDLGIGMGEKFVGKGYGKQIILCFIDYIFRELNAQKIVLCCHTDNIPSAKCQQACGLKYSHSEMHVRKKDNLECKYDYYTMTRDEWIVRDNENN